MSLPLSLRAALAACASVVVAGPLLAQGRLALLNKELNYVQTTAGAATPDTAAIAQFHATIEGTASDPTPPVSITLPNNGGTRALTFQTRDGESGWGLEQDFASQAAMTAAFPNGTYTYTFSGRSIPVAFSGDLYPNAPVATLSAGTFANGTLTVDRAQPLTITTAFTQNYTVGLSRIGINVSGPNVDLSNDTFSTGLNQSQLSLVVPANTFLPGATYTIELELNRIIANDTSSVPGLTIASVYSATTSIRVIVAGAPLITVQPQNASAAVGGSASFNVQVSNPAGVTFQWRRNGVNIPGANGPTYVLSPVQPTDNGAVFSVVVTNASGPTTSAGATLTVGSSGPPSIVSPPASQTIAQGASVVFSVGATGATSYQWRRDGVAIPGATGALLVLSGASAVPGQYSVQVANASGPNTSGNAQLGVIPTNDVGRLINLSILTDINPAGDSFIMGYVVGGGTAAPKPLVIRAAGPSLGALGVPGTLADPKMELYAGQTKTLENDNWGGAADLAAALEAVGAFAYTGPASKDAAVKLDVTTRDNSVKVSGVGTGTGTVIAEVYDATPGPGFTPATPRLLNVSVNKNIGTKLTAGFVIGGSTAKTVLIRAVGPGLAALGVPSGFVPDPQMALFGAGGVKIGENNDWGGSAALSAVASSVGAFTIPAASKDAALLVTLPPGNYSVEVTGAGNQSGIAVIEVYDVP
jgi:hypothetical protein